MKESRHRIILQELDQTGVVAVKNLKEMLGVTDMTIRRDLIDLEKQGMLTRVHGGAHKKVKNALNEISHSEKQMLNVEEKKQIARKCADLIADGDTVFIGSGTTTDFIGDYLDGKNISIVTNSLPIFEKLKERANLDLILIGGRYRAKTQTFVGQFANNSSICRRPPNTITNLMPRLCNRLTSLAILTKLEWAIALPSSIMTNFFPLCIFT